MLIIVEGADGVGKTTLVEKLEARIRELPHHEVTVLHKGPPEDINGLVEYELPLQDFRPEREKVVICDRWHLGEVIYGPLLRDVSRLSLPKQRHLELFLAARGAFIVHVTAPPDEVVDRQTQRGTLDLLPASFTHQIIDRYLEEAWNSLLECVDFVNTGYDPDDESAWFGIVNGVIIHAAQLASRTRWLSHHPTYVGMPQPEYLLFGERRNLNTDDRWTSAFAPVTPGTSGDFLLNHVPDRLLKSGLGIANILEDEDPAVLYRGLGRPRVVTLGREAHERCAKLEIPHGAVPHPQYVKRFHHKAGDHYERMIMRAAIFQEDYTSWRP